MEITRRTLLGAGAALAAGTTTATLAPAGASALLPAADGAATAWRLHRHDNARTANVIESTLSRANVGRLRLVKTGYIGDNQYNPRDPTVDGDTLVIGADQAMVVRYRLPAMTTAWRRTLYPNGEQEATSNAIGAERIICARFQMSAIDRTTGQVQWSTSAPEYDDYQAAPALTANAVYGVTRGGILSAYAPTTGKLLWSTPARGWHNTGIGDVWAAPAVVGARIYLVAENIACFDATTGKVLWAKALADYSLHPPVVSGTRVFVAGTKGVTAVSATSGQQLWRAAIGNTEAPAVVGNRIYAFSPSGLRCLDAATGRVLWLATAGLGKPVEVGVTHANGVLYFEDRLAGNFRLVAADARNGKVLWHGGENVGNTATELVVSGGALYVPTYDHTLLKFGL